MGPAAWSTVKIRPRHNRVEAKIEAWMQNISALNRSSASSPVNLISLSNSSHVSGSLTKSFDVPTLETSKDSFPIEISACVSVSVVSVVFL